MSTAIQEIDAFVRKLTAARAAPSRAAAAAGLFGVPENWSGEDEDIALKNQSDLVTLLGRLRRDTAGNQDAWEKGRRRVDAILRAYYYAQHAVYAGKMFHGALAALDAPEDDSEDKSPSADPCLGLSIFTPVTDDPKATTGQQKLILFMLYQAYRRQLRKYGDTCYRRVPHPEGYDTHAWQPHCSIKEFIMECCDKTTSFEYWSRMTNRGGLESTTTYLTHCRDAEFPALEKDRHIFSFSNGVYQAKYRRVDGRWTDRFLPYGGGVRLPEHKVAAKHFAQPFPAALAEDGGPPKNADGSYMDIDEIMLAKGWDPRDWRTIGTPALESIMATQQWPPEVQRWMYVMLGRLLYEVNDVDKWQVVPYFLGLAETGKSTILLSVVKRFFAFEDIAVLSSNCEKLFGLSTHADKFVMICPETRGNMGLEPADFLTMCSGDAMSLAVKFKDPKSVDWKVPAAFAGNTVPNWTDAASSISRRFMVFEYGIKPEKVDKTLGERLGQELPAIMLKANRAYQEAVHEVGSGSVDSKLPEYFKGTKDTLVNEVDSLRHFLGSSKLRFAPECYMRMSDLQAAYNAHCRENSFKQVRLVKTSYQGAFFEAGMRVMQDTREFPRGSMCMQNARWVIGAEEASAEVGDF